MPITIDAHSDILNDIHPRRLLGEKAVLERDWVPKMRKGGIDIRVVAIYTEPPLLPELALRRGLDLVASLYEDIAGSPSCLLCRTYGDIQRAKEAGKIGLILGMEGAEPLGMDIQLLRIFYELGLRVLGLTHALRTYLADGAFFSVRKTGQLGGLTDVGARFLEEAEKLGIVVDVSHLNDPSFWDVIKFAQAPVIASHSNCRALRDHLRNLTDDQIKAVADGGGVVGVNACSVFVNPPDLEHLVDHIDHIVKVGGIEHAGLGPDFADYLLVYMTEVDKASLPLDGVMPVRGLPGDEAFPRFAEELARRGYKPRDVDLIMGENFGRVFKEILKH
jgi:membrane dipeptidase